MPFDEHPTIEVMDREFHHLEELWNPAIEVFKQNDSFYLGTYNIWTWFFEQSHQPINQAVAQRPNYRSGRSHALIKHAVDANLALYPRWHREPIGKGQEHEKRADRLEKALSALVRDAFLWNYSHPPKVTAKDLISHNYAVLYVGLDGEALKGRPVRSRGENQEDFEQRELEWEMRRNGWNPIRMEAVSPGSVLMDPTLKMPPVAYRNRKMKAYQLADLTTTKVKLLGDVVSEAMLYEMTGDPYQDVDVIERWTAQDYAIRLKGGQMLWVENNGWAFQPYFHTWAGDAAEAIGQGFKAEDLARASMLRQAADTIIMHDQAVATHHNIIMRTGWARMGTRRDTAEAAQQLEGELLQGGDDDWWVEKTPQLASQSFQHLEYIKRQLEEITYSLSQAGFQETGVDTATQAIILSEANNRKSMSVREQMNHLYSIAGSNALRLASVMAHEYPELGSLSIGKDELLVANIGHNYRVQATFEMVDPVVFAQQKREAIEELKEGLIDRKTYHRIAQHENATEIDDNIILDTIRKLPQVQQELIDLALREEGFGKLADERERARRIAQMVGADGKSPLFPASGRNGGEVNARTEPLLPNSPGTRPRVGGAPQEGAGGG